MKTKLLFLLLLALLISCGKDSSDKSTELNPLTGPLSEQSDNTPSNTLIRRVFDIKSLREYENPDIKGKYLSSLNKRIIEFKLAPYQQLRDDCYDIASADKAKVSTTVNKQRIVQIQVELPLNKLAPTIIDCPLLVDNQIETKNFRLLPDLHLAGEEDNHYLRDIHNYSFEHIIFDQSISFIMNDHITLNAKKIVFYNSIFLTFPKELSKAKEDNDGLNGGELRLNTKEVLGSVSFKLTGQDGGDITRRPPGQPALPEDPTLNGNCKKNCNGKPGRPGLKGLKGYIGRNGGDSASFVLKFNKSLGLDLQYEVIPGRESLGGQGGEGGKGQLGGWNDQMDTSDPIRQCRQNCIRIPYEAMRSNKNTRAASGAHGAEGDRGEPGKSGEIIPSKIIHGGETTLLDRFTQLKFEVDYE